MRKTKNVALPNINWGRGRLNRYESFIGFAAKFCRLNFLPPKQFRQFWAASIGTLHYENEEVRIKRIAHLLDEPVDIVRSVFGIVGFGWKHLAIYQKKTRNNLRLYYCQACLADGFHGYFHQIDWLQKCPLHRIGLAKDPVPLPSNIVVDRNISLLANLLDSNCPGWETSGGRYRHEADIAKFSTLKKLLDWHKAIQESAVEWADSCLEIFGCNSFASGMPGRYDLRHLDMLMGRLHWITPLPKQITGLFVVSPYFQEPGIKNYGNQLTDELFHIRSKYPISGLLYLYKFANYVRGGECPFQQVVDDAIQLIISQHPPNLCQCLWGRGRSGGWRRFEPNTLHDFWHYQCPYEYAVGELGAEWLELLPEAGIQHARALNIYDRLACSVAEIGVVTLERRASRKTILGTDICARPILKFNWSRPFNLLIQEILSEIVKAHVKELRYWLHMTDNGNPPTDRVRFPPNLYLTQSSKLGVQLVCWPATHLGPSDFG